MQTKKNPNHHLNLQGIVAVTSKITNYNKEKVGTYRLIQSKIATNLQFVLKTKSNYEVKKS